MMEVGGGVVIFVLLLLWLLFLLFRLFYNHGLILTREGIRLEHCLLNSIYLYEREDGV